MRNAFVIVLMVAVLMQVGATRPAPASGPATRSRGAAVDPAKAAVRAATVALTQEFNAAQRDPAKASLRTTPNYFKDYPSSDVTPQAIVAALTASGGEPRQAAYVRWQLLSGLPEAIDDETVRGLLNAYARSPAPAPRPGMSRQDQQQLQSYVRGKKEADESDVNSALDQAINRVRNENGPIIAYRDELYRRLPKKPDAFVVAMEDAKQRLNAAAEGTEFVKAFAGDVRDWSLTTSPPPQQLAQIAKAVRKLADTESPQYYTSVTWSANAGSLSWNKSSKGLDSARELKDLAVFLEEQAAMPPLELNVQEKK